MGEGLERVNEVPFTVRADLDLSARIAPYLVEYDADVEIAAGDVPPSLHAQGWLLGNYQMSDRRILFAVNDGPRYLIEDGRRIVYARGGASERDLKLFLLGSAFGALYYQRGLLPLHASAILRGGAVDAFTGPSGAGKSTLVAAQADRGHGFFTDDVLILDAAADDATCYAGQKDLKLWADALELTSAATSGRVSDHATMEKFFATPGRLSGSTRATLRSLTLLAESDGDETPGIDPIRGGAAVAALLQSVYRIELGQLILGRERIFRRVAALAGTIALQRFRRSKRRESFGASLDFLAAEWKATDER